MLAKWYQGVKWHCCYRNICKGVFLQCPVYTSHTLFSVSTARDCAPQVIDNAHPPEIFHDGQTVTYSYRCYNGYSLLYNNSSLSCTNGQLQGKTPICTSELYTTLSPLLYWLYTTGTSITLCCIIVPVLSGCLVFFTHNYLLLKSSVDA